VHSGVPSAVNLGQATGRENWLGMGSWGSHRDTGSVRWEFAVSVQTLACEPSTEVNFIPPKAMPASDQLSVGWRTLGKNTNICYILNSFVRLFLKGHRPKMLKK
jgi:hypothetical protein